MKEKSFAETIFYINILNDYVNCIDLITLLINYVVGGYSIKFSNRASVIKVGNVSLMVRGQVN